MESDVRWRRRCEESPPSMLLLSMMLLSAMPLLCCCCCCCSSMYGQGRLQSCRNRARHEHATGIQYARRSSLVGKTETSKDSRRLLSAIAICTDTLHYHSLFVVRIPAAGCCSSSRRGYLERKGLSCTGEVLLTALSACASSVLQFRIVSSCLLAVSVAMPGDQVQQHPSFLLMISISCIRMRLLLLILRVFMSCSRRGRSEGRTSRASSLLIVVLGSLLVLDFAASRRLSSALRLGLGSLWWYVFVSTRTCIHARPQTGHHP